MHVYHAYYNESDSSIVPHGPIYNTAIQYNPTAMTVTLSFDSTQSRNKGLKFHGTEFCVSCCSEIPYRLLANDTNYYRAKRMKIDDTINYTLVTILFPILPNNVTAVKLQYNYEDYPQCSLYNSHYIPAFPFSVPI